MEDSENKWIEDKLLNSIALAKRVFSAIDELKSFLEERLEVEKRVGQLSFMMKTLLRFITTSAKKSLYLRPVDRILEEVQGILKHALDIACKFNLKSVICRFFNTPKTTDFQTVFRNLDDSIGNMKWLLIVYDPINNGAFGGIVVFLPPFCNNNPIFLLVWSCIGTVQMGRRLSDRIDAIDSLGSLAQDNNLYKKYIVAEGGLPPLLKILKVSTSLYAQLEAANALCILTNDPEIMKNIVIVIVRLLKDAPIEVQIQAANLVARMAEENAAIECDSAEGNVIWPLVALLSSETSADEPEKRELKINCAEALWTLAARSVSNCRTITNTKALLCLANLVEKESGKLRYYCLMTIMEIATVAESDIHFRQAVFKTNSPSAKAVVDQLLRVIKESNDPIQQIPAIRSIGSLARIFPSRETAGVIGPLVSLLHNRHLTVATEAAIALQKFLCPENYLHIEHWKSVIECISFPALMRLIGDGNKMQRHRWALLICCLFCACQQLQGYYSLSNYSVDYQKDKDYPSPEHSHEPNFILCPVKC
ncbi:uncharacterized protein LOC111308489 [Durio zibethinus]|uniref:Uncharacterized protein LOC111308489 n=1 Tax=Durio zibethinus TaxID=66656 RepID=A0A6P6ACE6_DURZI|nr:uncharacterized protein LOC111308489 [Durio zibethinus]